MKTVARLIFSYFDATAWSRWATLIGLCGIIFAIVNPPTASLQTAQLMGLAGIAAFFVGSAKMPIMAGHLLQMPSTSLLPFGRSRVLLSAILTATLTAIPLPIISVLVMIASNSKRAPGVRQEHFDFMGIVQTPFFWQMYLIVLLLCTWLYVVLWFGMRHRNSTPGIRTWLIAIVLIVIPSKYIRLTPDTHWAILLTGTAASWTLIGVCCIYGPRSRKSGNDSLQSIGERFRKSAASDETSLLLGTTHPWLIQFALMTGIMVALNVLATPLAWISYLAFCGLLIGGYSCNAAARSHALWLRRPWDREALFRSVELHFWLHNSVPRLAVLTILMVAIGVYTQQSATVITLSALLLVLVTAVGTYLGLSVTRALGWSESFLTIAAMTLMTSVIYVIARRNTDIDTIWMLLVALALLAAATRQLARRRWTTLDWMTCKPIRLA